MQIQASQSSPWVGEFHQQLMRGKSVILHGNIHDHFILNGETVSLETILNRYTTHVDHPYEVVAHYDIADGVRLLEEARSRPIFERLLREGQRGRSGAASSTTLESASAATETTAPPAPGGRTVPPNSAQAGGGSGGAGSGSRHYLRPTDTAFAAFRHVLAQSEVSAAIIIEFGDRMTQEADRFNETERPTMVELEKAIRDCAYITKGPMRGLKNACVIVCNQLATVPAWLYRDNPFVQMIHIGKPRNEERGQLLRVLWTGFFGSTPLPPEPAAAITGPEAVQLGPEAEAAQVTHKRLVDLTDGMTALDLYAIQRASKLERLSVGDPRQLVDFFKYGRRDNPWQNFDSERIRNATAILARRIIGQDQPLRAVVDMLISARVGIDLSESSGHEGRPQGVFFFVGPTGVGKTELAKALTDLIFSDERALKRFDMSEYKEEHTTQRLTGAPPGYVGYGDGGQLTNRVLERPFSVLLFDEIEKAHPRVLDLFLQILDDGRLTDSKGQTAYFSQSVIIFTSNIGADRQEADIKSAAVTNDDPPYEKVRELYQGEVKKHFDEIHRPELLNRLGDNVLVFDLLRPRHVRAITQKFLNHLAQAALAKRGLILDFGDDVIGYIQYEMGKQGRAIHGGRRVRTEVDTWVRIPLNKWIFEHNPPPGARLTLHLDHQSGELEVGT